jgi:phage baseplate assembly protein W
MMDIRYPFQIDGRGIVADAAEDAHIRQMIEQVLFTAPGERVNRSTFGAALQQLVFAPNSPELATATEFMVQGALQQWLGDRVILEGVKIISQDATLDITVQYTIRKNQQRQVAKFSRET